MAFSPYPDRIPLGYLFRVLWGNYAVKPGQYPTTMADGVKALQTTWNSIKNNKYVMCTQ